MEFTVTEAFKDQGFHLIGTLRYRIHLNVWWNPDSKIQLLQFPLGSKTLLKGSKSYHMKSISQQGETWAREIAPLHDYLENHFPEIHINFSHFRDISDSLAGLQIERKNQIQSPTISIPTTEELADLQYKLEEKYHQQQSLNDLLGLGSNSSDMLSSYIRNQVNTIKVESKQFKKEFKDKKNSKAYFKHLQGQYQRNSSAAIYLFSICSNSHVASTPNELSDSIINIAKELHDMHRYEVTQKLNGGRLNIHIEEADEPVMVWIEEWLGGGLSPRQFSKLGTDISLLRESTEKHTMITPDTDITVDGAVKEDQKLIASRVLSTFVTRLDNTDTGADLHELETDTYAAKIGKIVKNGRITSDWFTLPLSKSNHIYISGQTGSGKSYLGRVIVEEAARYKDLNILILDPANQSAGLLTPEDRDTILALYPDYGMKPGSSRGYNFNYYAPGIGIPLPNSLSTLGTGKNIVSLKNLNDLRMCTIFREILDAVFKLNANEESKDLRSLIVVEEAHRFTKKRVSEDAKSAGEQAEMALDRTVREGRKYGCNTCNQSQSIKDFARDSASIRQNTPTKIFMSNSDREIAYAADFIGDGRQIIHLKPATAIIYNAIWGAVTVKIRPPLSKVWDFGPEETRQLLASEETSLTVLSQDARGLLSTVRDYYNTNNDRLNISNAGMQAGITSKRLLQQLVEELETTGFVKTYRLNERGRPRIIESISSRKAD